VGLEAAISEEVRKSKKEEDNPRNNKRIYPKGPTVKEIRIKGEENEGVADEVREDLAGKCKNE
jgi:hypothetical protein